MSDVDLRPLNLISLCTGGGGLDRAVELAIPNARPIVCVEREAFAVASLVAQIEAGLMAPAAIHGDVRTFPGRRFRGLVDGLIGGIPCQGHSLAGRRQGRFDERDLWSAARRIIAQARPWFVLIENVGGMLSPGADEIAGAERVRRGLRKLGYQSTLVIVRADQMGLPHERLRVFILGVADWFLADGWGNRREGPVTPDETPAERRRLADSGSALAYGDGQRRGTDEPEQARRGQSLPAKRGDDLADGLGAGLEGRRPPGSRSRKRAAAERGGERLGDAKRSRRTPAGRGPALEAGAEPEPGSGNLGHAGSRRLHGDDGRQPDVVVANGRRDVVHAIGRGRPGRAESEVRESVKRAAEQQLGALRGEQRLANGDGAEPAAERRDAGEVRGLSEGEGGSEHGAALSRGGRPFLRPPGPGDVDAWRVVAERSPDLLPAVSRYDRLRLAMGVQGFVADGDPSSGAWVDAQTGARVHAAVLPQAIELALRGVADVMAPRIDELRMLGNGVADAQGALAVRIGAHDLAARGSAGAALLVRMMDNQP